jgi:hypothetical protein
MAGKPGMHTRLLSPARAEEIREKIRATLIVKKLEDHILEAQEMSPSQVTAALGLLKKAVPDLAAITHEGNENAPLAMTITWKQPKS